MYIQFWSRYVKTRDDFGNLDVDERICFKLRLREVERKGEGLDSTGSGKGPMAGYWKHDNELSSFVKEDNLLTG
jgi:hypothetical protein